MAPIVALLILALVSLLVVRIGSTALMMTGLSWDTANFQAYSAFFGVGFTTKEAEMVVNHPVRRRIIRDLIIVGNIGLTSALATLIVTLLQSGSDGNTLVMLVWMLGGIAALFLVVRIGWLQKITDRLIRRMLERTGMVRALDYELLLRIQHGYVVSEIEILPRTWLEGRSLREARPWDRGVVILAITRDGVTNPGLPEPTEILHSGDVITAYGKEDALRLISHPIQTDT